ncbi:MAG: hypothetical protein LUH36_08735 [Oscillospiraceae bacterium]|nr:hypothetical protein [Oscillospiraceae bacterium]
MKRQIQVLGRVITATITQLDDGLDVSLLGGDISHIGAVSLAGTAGLTGTISRPGHKEYVLTEKWALTLADRYKMPATVRGGIHYNNATPEQIDAIIAGCDGLLRMICSEFICK